MSISPPLLQVKGLTFTYENSSVLKDLSVSLRAGEVASLIGVSGAGKSTFFKLLTGMIEPIAGEIVIAGHTLPSAQQQVAYLMQEDLLLPWRTVLSNVTLVAELGPDRRNLKELTKKARERIAEVGLRGRENSLPESLSGGQRQRVAIARALLLDKPLLLLDEPFFSLDPLSREQLFVLLRTLQKRYGMTILMATHDFRDALCLSDRILLLNEGRIAEQWIIDEEIRQEAMAMSDLHQRLREALGKVGGVQCATG